MCARYQDWIKNLNQRILVTYIIAGNSIQLSGSLAGLQSQLEDFQTQINTLGTANSALQTQVDTLETANSTLQESVDTLETANSTLQTQINTLETANSALQTLLSGVSRLKVGGYDTLRFSGMNLQIINGKGSTVTSNGLGNLIVGYNELRGGTRNNRSGSHYIIIGDKHNYSAYGGIVNGYGNTANGHFASVSGGKSNTASNEFASVSGSGRNTANGHFASVSGGYHNTASARCSSILGGADKTISTKHGIYPN